MAPQRILIIGDGGSGKSTLADKLEATLKITATHLDLLRCDDTFELVESDVYLRRHDAVLGQERWIIEGIPRLPLDSPTALRRLRDCDAVVYLDYSPLVTLWRSWRRSADREADGTAIPRSARYRFNAFNVYRTLIFYCRVRPQILRDLKVLRSAGKLVLIARNDAELEGAHARLTGARTEKSSA